MEQQLENVEVKMDTSEIEKAIRRSMLAGAKAGAEVVRSAIVSNLGTGHGGVPSEPLSPPNTQLGNLRDSIVSRPDKDDDVSYRIAAGGTPAVPYARALEYGYEKRKLAPRPYFFSGAAESRERAMRLYAEAARAEFRELMRRREA